MSKASNIPPDYNTVMPYLLVKNAKGFAEFLKSVFDAEEKEMVMRSEDLVMHGEVMIGESMIMFADCGDQFPACTAGMFVYVDDADKRYAKALEHGATALMPLSDQPYGRSGGVTDAFGNTWWITSLK